MNIYYFFICTSGTKRPRGPNLQPRDSSELRDYLERLGLGLEEFEEMRTEREEEDSGAQGAAGQYFLG